MKEDTQQTEAAMDETEYLQSSDANAERLQESVDQLNQESMALRTEPEYSQKDVYDMLERLETQCATQFNMLAKSYQDALDSYGTNMQVQFELAKYPFGGSISPLTQQFLDTAKANKAKVEEELNGDSNPE